MLQLVLKNSSRVALVDDDDAPTVGGLRWQCIEPQPGYLYVTAKRDGRNVYLHRLVMGAKKGECVDHINGDTLDNRRANLRLCSHAENMRNRKRSKASKFPYKGIGQRRDGTKYVAIIRCDGKKFQLGTFDSAEAAAMAYDDAAVRLHGEFARLNFPNKKKFSRSKPLNTTQLGC